jgi:hypothetical protein
MTPEERARRVVQAEPEQLQPLVQAEIEEALVDLLRLIGTEGICRGCGAGIWWVRHANDRPVPYSRKGINHFIDCPNAKDFRREPRNERRD